MRYATAVTLGHYLPKSYFKPDFFSLQVLALKKKDLSASLFFYRLLKNRLAVLQKDYYLVCVPSSQPDSPSPLVEMCAWLARDFPNFFDYSAVISKKYATQSLCRGGSRNLEAIKASLRIDTQFSLKGKRIIILDDVITTGASFRACADLLAEFQPLKISYLALAATKLKKG